MSLAPSPHIQHPRRSPHISNTASVPLQRTPHPVPPYLVQGWMLSPTILPGCFSFHCHRHGHPPPSPNPYPGPDLGPYSLEHFGIGVAECMLQGLFPIVAHGGGVLEVVGSLGVKVRSVPELVVATRAYRPSEQMRTLVLLQVRVLGC